MLWLGVLTIIIGSVVFGMTIMYDYTKRGEE